MLKTIGHTTTDIIIVIWTATYVWNICECKFDLTEREYEKVKLKNLSRLSRNSSLKKIVFERFNEHLPHFQFKSDFFCIVILSVQILKICKRSWQLTKLTNTEKGWMRLLSLSDMALICQNICLGRRKIMI